MNSSSVLAVKENMTFCLNSIFSGSWSGPSLSIRQTRGSPSVATPSSTCELPQILSSSYKTPHWWCNTALLFYASLRKMKMTLTLTNMNEQKSSLLCVGGGGGIKKSSWREFRRLAGHLLDIFRHVSSAGLLLLMCWRGESRSTICWSVKVSALVDFFFLLLSLYSNPPPPPCSLSTLTLSRCSAPYFTLNSPQAPRAVPRTYSPFKFIKSLWQIEPRWTTVAEIRLRFGAAAVRLDDFSLLLFIYDAGAGWWLFIWPFCRPLFEDDLKGDGRVIPLCLCSHCSTEMNTAYL